MLRSKMFLFSLTALLLAACSTIVRSESSLGANLTETKTTKTCPVTQPAEPAFVPPEPYPAQPPFEGVFWYGSPDLWTLLPQDGVWQALPYDEKTGYTQKVLFWRDGYQPAQEPQPDITLRGIRLDGEGDGDAASFETDHATNAMGSDIGSAMLVGVEIPAAGCWQFTASYADQELSFTLQVKP